MAVFAILAATIAYEAIEVLRYFLVCFHIVTGYRNS